MIATSFDNYIELVNQAESKILNEELGQKVTGELLKLKLAANPDLTEEEWDQTKK